MGEPDQNNSAGPGIPGFAKSFAAISRQPGQPSSRAVPKLVLISVVVAVAIAGTLGVGVLISAAGKKADSKASATKAGQSPLSAVAAGQSLSAVSPQPASPPPSSNSGKDPAAAAQHHASSVPAQQTPQPATSTPTPLLPATSTPTPSLPTYPIVGIGSNRCIDIPNGNANTSTPLQIWDCTGTAWQQWTFPSDGTIRSKGKCMQLSNGSTADGTPIVMGECDGGPAQRFTLNSSNDLVNVSADKCVDVKDKATNDGATLQLWSCTGTTNQKWARG